MRAVVQRVSQASVRVDDRVVGQIGPGIVVLLGVRVGDTEEQADWLADKVVNLRIFQDDQDKMNKSLLDVGGEALIVSQFTLYGDCRKGRRPTYVEAARPEEADRLYQLFVQKVQGLGVKVSTGQFQARMKVALDNDGPVTLIVEKESA